MTSTGPFDELILTSPAGDDYRVTVNNDGALAVTKIVVTPPQPTKPTVTDVSVTTTKNTANLTWKLVNGTTATAGRDGKDASGYGAWTSDLLTVTNQTFTQLIPGTEYTFTVTPTGGDPVSVKAKTVADVVTPDPDPQPTNSVYKAVGYGASVTGAANGDFNKWTGKRAAFYSTWADNGKCWGIDTASSEYGSNAVARLGDFDLHIAMQMRLTSNWAGAANGDLDATFRKWITEYKSKWGNRKGHLFIGPFHEFNGNWYQWSVRNATDSANFVKTWRRLRGIWNEVIGNDTRFHMTWVPNRDSSAVGAKASFPGAQYVDVICPDYYDFAKPTSEAAWNAENSRTEYGDSPVGLQKWIDFAKSVGLPLLFQEWGQQFGDNPLFINKVTAIFDANGYTGSGNPAGKVLGYTWHNLQGSSPDPNAGGDFFIQRGGSDYSGRKNASKALREFIQKTNLRQP